MLVPGLALAAGGPVLLRRGWNRSLAFVVAGWAAFALAGLLVLRADGAWGLAVGCTIASCVALGLLALAALRSPAARSARAAREALPQAPARFDGTDLARRIAIFLVVGILDLISALILAWACQRLAFVGGIAEANALIIGLFALPLAWAALASWQMTRSRIRDMLAAALATALTGGLAWLTL